MGTWELGNLGFSPSEQVPDDLAHPLQIPNSIATFPGELPGKRQVPREPWARVNSDVLEVSITKIATQRLRGQRPQGQILVSALPLYTSGTCGQDSQRHFPWCTTLRNTSLSGQILKFRRGKFQLECTVGLSIIANFAWHAMRAERLLHSAVCVVKSHR